MSNLKSYKNHLGSRPEKYFKDTLFNGKGMMLGVNCLDPGQEQSVHVHDDQDKVYIVMEGEGRFTVGEQTLEAKSGDVIWAEAGLPHGVQNTASTLLVILVVIAPPPN